MARFENVNQFAIEDHTDTTFLIDFDLSIDHVCSELPLVWPYFAFSVQFHFAYALCES